jgi:hypothetical protein
MAEQTGFLVGRRLSPDGVDVRLERMSTQPFRSGVTLLTYRPAAG